MQLCHTIPAAKFTCTKLCIPLTEKCFVMGKNISLLHNKKRGKTFTLLLFVTRAFVKAFYFKVFLFVFKFFQVI